MKAFGRVGRSLPRVHHHLRIFRGLRLWQLTLIAVFLAAVGIMQLRANSVQAIKLYNDVKAADAALNDKDTQKALHALQTYVSQHMNAHLDRITLEKTYERDYQAAVAKVTGSGSTNDAKYHEAELGCRDILRRTASFTAYAQCVANNVGQTPSGQNPLLAADLPQPYRYEYVFASPDWSPDAAGLTLLAAGIIWLIIMLRLLLELALSLLARRRREA